MEDEEFEKQFKKLLDKFDDFMFMDSSGLEGTEIIKQQIKQILEEIESKNFRLGYEACDIDIADSEAKS